MDRQLSERIWATRYLMVIGIIVLHLPPYQPFDTLGDFGFDYIKAFFTHAVFKASVPVLTVISGFLLFNFSLHKKPKKLVEKKTKSLLIPLILWNIPLAIAIFCIEKYALLGHEFSAQLYPIHISDWINALTGLFGEPANYPLNFLRDLLIISLVAPLLWPFLKYSPYLGLFAVLCVFYFNIDGDLIIRNAMLVSFYIGGMAAFQQWDLTRLDRYAGWLLCVFLFLCVLIIVFEVDNTSYFRLIAPFMVWPAMSLVMNTRLASWLVDYSSNSFFTFLIHAPIILVLWLIYHKSFPGAPYWLYWVFAPMITVVLSVALNRIFKKLVPTIHELMLGGR